MTRSGFTHRTSLSLKKNRDPVCQNTRNNNLAPPIFGIHRKLQRLCQIAAMRPTFQPDLIHVTNNGQGSRPVQVNNNFLEAS